MQANEYSQGIRIFDKYSGLNELSVIISQKSRAWLAAEFHLADTQEPTIWVTML